VQVWHKSGALNIPKNLSIRFRGKPSTGRFSFPLNLPPYSPELNPTENIWQFLRQTYLSNRVFETWEAIVDACCDAWNRLTTEPGRINSIATRNWDTEGQ
jgi:transposase